MIGIAVLWIVLALSLAAALLVPRYQRRLLEGDELEEAWMFPHEDRPWSEPRARARAREPEAEEHA